MKPMTPMKPMAPMEPMEPMKPMAAPERWWPEEFGAPSSSGSQNGLRYAFFRDPHRLIIDRHGQVTTFDTGHHLINGVSQSGGAKGPSFSTNDGVVDMADLKRV